MTNGALEFEFPYVTDLAIVSGSPPSGNVVEVIVPWNFSKNHLV